jgi:hypothetical protein
MLDSASKGGSIFPRESVRTFVLTRVAAGRRLKWSTEHPDHKHLWRKRVYRQFLVSSEGRAMGLLTGS